MTEKTRREKGKEMLQTVYQGAVQPPENCDDSPYWQNMLDSTFGEMWANDVLSLRDRRLMAIGILAASGNFSPIVIQLKVALQTGQLTEAQVKQIPVFLAHYIGMPLAGQVYATMVQAGLPA